MNILDIILAVIVIVFILSGLRKGIIIGIVGLIGTIVAFLAAGVYEVALSKVVGRAVPDVQWRDFISFYLIFIAILIVAGAIGAALKKILLSMFHTKSEQVMVFLLSALRALLICTIVVISFNRYLPNHNLTTQSAFAPMLTTAAELLNKALPDQATVDNARHMLENAASSLSKTIEQSAEETKQRLRDSLE